MSRATPSDIVSIEFGVGELAALLGAVVGLAAGLGIADNIHSGLMLATSAGTVGYFEALLVTLASLVIGTVWALLTGLGFQILIARIAARWLDRGRVEVQNGAD